MKPITFARICAVLAPFSAFLLIISLPLFQPNERWIPGCLLYALGAMFVMALQLSVATPSRPTPQQEEK